MTKFECKIGVETLHDLSLHPSFDEIISSPTNGTNRRRCYFHRVSKEQTNEQKNSRKTLQSLLAMGKSRFRCLQLALFLGSVSGVSWADADSLDAHMASVAAVSQDNHDVYHTVPRHAVLRRHLQGQPAFAVGALGNVGMISSMHETDKLEQYASRAADLVLPFFHEYDETILLDDSDRKVGTLQWTGDIKYSLNGGTHLRFEQVFGDRIVEGGNIVVHIDAMGNVVAVNGEFVDCREVINASPDLYKSPREGVTEALELANIKNIIKKTAPEVTLVVADDLSCCLAYKSHVTYWQEEEEEESRMQKQDIVYVDVLQGHLCARDPIFFGSTTPPSLATDQKRASTSFVPTRLRRRVLENMALSKTYVEKTFNETYSDIFQNDDDDNDDAHHYKIRCYLSLHQPLIPPAR